MHTVQLPIVFIVNICFIYILYMLACEDQPVQVFQPESQDLRPPAACQSHGLCQCQRAADWWAEESGGRGLWSSEDVGSLWIVLHTNMVSVLLPLPQ